jgi:hypothetical protein
MTDGGIGILEVRTLGRFVVGPGPPAPAISGRFAGCTGGPGQD